MTTLQATKREYRRNQRLAALGVAEAERLAPRGPVAVAKSVQAHQAAAVQQSLGATAALLAEQGISQAQEATPNPAALLTATQGLAEMLSRTDTMDALGRLVATFIADAGRTARAVDIATRPAVSGYVRAITLPACVRCVILAGRLYRYDAWFERHPQCDCIPTPTNRANGVELVTDPEEALASGQVHGLSAGDLEAIDAGADLNQVVNVRRKAAGLIRGSSVLARAGRLTPQGCLDLASDRQQALALLTEHGYLI